MIKSITLFSLLVMLSCQDIAAQFYNVLQYGAKNDSSSIATKAIEKAIAAASKAGGGTIYFPAGKYLTGPIHLKSNITIFIDAGAELPARVVSFPVAPEIEGFTQVPGAELNEMA